MGELVAKEHAESGRTIVRPGFWEKINNEHFAGRGFTAKMLESRRSNQLYEKKKRLASGAAKESRRDGKEQKKTSLKDIFSNEEQQLMERLVKEELQQCGGERVRPGFWGGVLETYFADRNLTTEQLRDYYKRTKRRGVVASEDLSSSNDAQATNNSHGVPFTSDEDEIVIKEAVNELREHGKLHYGFWPKVVENHSLNRTPTQLKSRYTHLKSRGKINLSETSSSSDVGGTVTSEQSEAIPTADEGPRDVQDAKSHSDTAPLTDDLIVFPAYQATTTKYPPQTLVTYRPSSGKANTCIVGRVLEVGIYPSQDNLYVYTIKSDDDASTYKRLPERLLEKR